MDDLTNQQMLALVNSMSVVTARAVSIPGYVPPPEFIFNVNASRESSEQIHLRFAMLNFYAMLDSSKDADEGANQ